jgi:ATP-dependent Clp protease ATP-binding subunit ClpC
VLDRYSDRARRVVGLAGEESRALGHEHVGTEHLLLGILADGQTPAAAALDAAGATLARARLKVAEAVGERRPETTPGDVPLTARAKRALERASRFSLQRRSPEIETEHILLALLNVEGTASQVLRGLGVDLVALHDAVVAGPDADAPPKKRPRAAKRSPEPKPARVRAPAPPPAPEPRCGECGTPLAGGVLVRAVPARDEAGGAHEIRVVFCARCGSALGVSP